MGHIVSLAIIRLEGKVDSVAGYLLTVLFFKKIGRLHVNDGSHLNTIGFALFKKLEVTSDLLGL